MHPAQALSDNSTPPTDRETGFLLSWQRNDPLPSLHLPQSDPIKLKPEGLSCLVLSGWIANRLELADSLDLPQPAADEHILLALFERDGAAAASRLAGALSWVVWDGRQRQVTACRDRLGLHALYYASPGADTWLSTDLALLSGRLPGSRRFNLASLITHLHTHSPQPGETWDEGIQVIQPGSLLVVTPQNCVTQRYWSIGPRPLLRLASDDEYAEAYRSLLFDVVRGYLSNQPLGVTLSSGMDSTSIAAAVRAVAPGADLLAVTYTSPELPQAEELPLARLAAERLALPQLTSRADLHWTLSGPQGLHTDRASPFLLYFEEMWDDILSIFQQQDVSLVFDGMSGDNLFGGSVFSYPDLLLTGRWRQLLREFRYHLPRSPLKPTAFFAARSMIVSPIVRAYLPFLARRRDAPVPWLRREHLPFYWELSQPARPPALMLPGRLQRLRHLSDPFIFQVAEHTTRRALARHGIQLLRPLLDHRLFEFAAALPTTQTFRRGQRKIIMRNAMRGRLPDEIVDMWGKITPEVISERGLRERETERIWSLMAHMRLADCGLVDPEVLRQHYQDYLDGKHSDAVFWYTLTLEDWLRRYF